MRFIVPLACSIMLVAPAQAQDIAPERRHTPEDRAEIVVTAQRRERIDLLSAVTVVSGDELVRELKPSLGETLARQPGVSSTSFGPAASRPILRGLSGDRLRVLTDGIGSFDASTTSADHAVVINPLTAERIEILRGPAALLFGSSAIGGVVNVIDHRIPRRVPDEAVHAEALALYGTAAEERTLRGEVDVALGSKLVAHIDGSYAKTDDLRTGGFVLSRRLRNEAAASGDPAVAELADLRGEVPNSALRTWDVAGGLAYVDDRGTFGVSAARYDSLYGIPVRYATTAGGEAEAVRLDVRQWRYDARGELKFASGFAQQLLVRGGYADYRHDELEEDGAIGTSFFNTGGELRAELVQRARGAWSGSIGAQGFARDFRAEGEEKFVPPTRTRQFGLFALQNFNFNPVLVEAGVRIERTRVSATADDDLGTPAARRQFTALSASLGAGYRVTDNLRAGLNLNRAVRAPNAEELFARGPHAGTQVFEIGDPGLRSERSTGGELFLRGNDDAYSFELTAYYNRFSNFIYQFASGEVDDDLPVYITRQGRATQSGFEAQARLRLARLGTGAVWVEGLADYTRVNIRNFGPAPLIPPLRLLGGVGYQAAKLDAGIEVEHVTRQTRNAVGETETPGFTLANASLTYRPGGEDGAVTLSFAANNLFDVEARRHSSLLKEYAPLAGRDFRFTVGLRY